jgi:hypothetical protein
VSHTVTPIGSSEGIEFAGRPAEPFDLDDLDALDTAEMVVISNGKPTDWVWTFAGPGHPKAIAASNAIARERLRLDAAQEQARVNGKKWKAEEETPAEALNRNATYVIDRLIGWSPVKMGGQDFPFTTENARKLLTDPKKGALALQAMEFLAEANSFTRRSVKA